MASGEAILKMPDFLQTIDENISYGDNYSRTFYDSDNVFSGSDIT